MMPIWKKNIFVNAIQSRMISEEKLAELIIEDYKALTAEEKDDILNTISNK